MMGEDFMKKIGVKNKKRGLVNFNNSPKMKSYKPYFTRTNVELYLANSIEFMNKMSPNQVDMIFC